MARIGLWHVTEGQPRAISAGSVQLEEALESWIEHDPDLVQAELVIVGRQVHTDAGRIDLLALDLQGRWVVIEIKRGSVRRDTLAQVIDDASVIASLASEELRGIANRYLQRTGRTLASVLEEREAEDSLETGGRQVLLVVVGMGREPGLDRMAEVLASKYSVPLLIVTFDVFQTEAGQHILAREVTEPDVPAEAGSPASALSVEQALSAAAANGTAESFQKLLNLAEEAGVYARPWKTSIMFTPPGRKNRMLFTVWARPVKGKIKTYVSSAAFAEFYPISEPDARAIIGPDGYRYLTPAEMDALIADLRKLFADIELRTCLRGDRSL